MKINVFLKTESNEKLNVLLKMAYEMGMHVQIGDTDFTPDEDAEILLSHQAQLQDLKAVFAGEVPSPQKIKLLTDAAKAIGIQLSVVPDGQLQETLQAYES